MQVFLRSKSKRLIEPGWYFNDHQLLQHNRRCWAVYQSQIDQHSNVLLGFCAGRCIQGARNIAIGQIALDRLDPNSYGNIVLVIKQRNIRCRALLKYFNRSTCW